VSVPEPELHPVGAAHEEAEFDVSIVLPVHNEAGHLEAEIDRIIEAITESAYSWELIIVDDGSSDDSAEIARGRKHVRVLRSARNRGAGRARRVGTEAAVGQVIVWSDADLTYPNDMIPWLVDQLGSSDQVVGARTSERGSLKFVRVPAKWMIRRLAIYLTRTKIPDLNSGFRAFRREVGAQFIHQLPDGFSCVTTMTMTFLMNGYDVTYVPIEYRERAGRSKFHWWADTRRYMFQVIRMMLSYDPLRVFFPISVLLGLVFAGKLGFDIIDKDFRPASNTILLGFATLQVLVVGLLADLVVRTSRPAHLLRSADVTEDDNRPPAQLTKEIRPSEPSE